MIEIDQHSALAYLNQTGRVVPADSARVEPLAWGVSNIVLRVSPSHGDDFVLKQSRRQLRTREEWLSSLDRIYREVAIIETLAPLLPEGAVPRVLFQDRENYLFGMEAVAADHVVWKAELLEGTADRRIARQLGIYLATIHRATAGDEQLQQSLGDRRVFDELRIDPFYRFIAKQRPEIRQAVELLIDEMDRTPACVVLADFSPKNVLLTQPANAGEPRRITLVDFETGHFGDPAFDLGFFLTHLLLKAVLHGTRGREFIQLAEEFWKNYGAGLRTSSGETPFDVSALEARTVKHLAACMFARIDGKSPVDYLRRQHDRALVRRLATEWLNEPPATLAEVFTRLESQTPHAADDSMAAGEQRP